VPAGFQAIRRTLEVAGDLDGQTRVALEEYAEQYCPVYQTPASPPSLETSWAFE
jgi:uncharacterized OsmC-like protein